MITASTSRETLPPVGQIATDLRSAAPEWFGRHVTIDAPPQIQARPWSFMLRYPLKGWEAQAILVKIARQKGADLAGAVQDQALLWRTEKEYAMLAAIERIFASNAGGDFCYIRPLAFWPQWNALVMEELEAQPLKKYLFRLKMGLRDTREWKRFVGWLAVAGRWLRIYHEEMDTGPKVVSLRMTDFRKQTEEILGQGSALSSVAGLGSVREAVFHIIQIKSGDSLPVAMLHSDFHCGNILVASDGRIGALDADRVRGPVYGDLAKLLADLETRSVQMVSQGQFIPLPQLQTCSEAFLHGYFGEQPYDRDFLELFLAVAVLFKWMRDEQALKQVLSLKDSVRKYFAPFWRRYYLKLVKSHLGRISVGQTVYG